MGIDTLSTIVTYSDSTISTYEIVGQLSAGQISNEAIGISVGSLVSSIGESAFYENAKLSSVIFADGTSISSIGNFAFYGCTSLSSIEIPGSLKDVNDGVFSVGQSFNKDRTMI